MKQATEHFAVKAGLLEPALAHHLVVNKIGITQLNDEWHDYISKLGKIIITWRAHGMSERDVIRRARDVVDSNLYPTHPDLLKGINPVVHYLAHVEELYPATNLDNLAREIAISRAPSIAAARRLIHDAIDAGLIICRKHPFGTGRDYLLAHEPITRRVMSVYNTYLHTDRRVKYPDGMPITSFRHDVCPAIYGGIYRAEEAIHRAINAGVLKADFRKTKFGTPDWFITSAKSPKGVR